MGGVGGHAALEINDIPIVRYWAQAPDGKSTKHRIAAALDLVCEPVGTRSNAKRGMGGGHWGGRVAQGAEWESLKNATVPGPRPAQHRHRTIYGIVARELVPRPMQPRHADGRFWPATIVARLTMAYCARQPN